MFDEKKSCKHGRVKLKGTMTQWPVEKHRTAQKHAEYQEAIGIQNKLMFVVFGLQCLLLKHVIIYACVCRDVHCCQW